ncbi:MAG: aryl-sulfate sulfotransferase [Promethearchaeota archaeon]
MRRRNTIILAIVFAIIIIGVLTATVFFLLTQSTQRFIIEVHDSSQSLDGTTLFADLHDKTNPRIVEVNMNGEIVWEYILPDQLKDFTEPGMDVESLPNGNILFLCPRLGAYEIQRDGTIVWSYLNANVSHDVDRLPNHNTLLCWGGGDTKDDAQAFEVHPNGTIVWKWLARDYFNIPPYDTISSQGWTHANAVTRMPNGHTLINLRNFNLTVEVNRTGHVIWQYDWSVFGRDPHEPEVLPNGNVLIAIQGDVPYQAVEINRTTGQVVWQYGRENMIFTRDADRLSNGNTLLVAIVNQRSKIFEVTSSGEIVWELAWGTMNSPVPGWFYKAERIPSP